MQLTFLADPYPIHIDATLTPIKPGLILNNPQRRLPELQREMFEKNGWEIVDAIAHIQGLDSAGLPHECSGY